MWVFSNERVGVMSFFEIFVECFGIVEFGLMCGGICVMG